MPAPKMFALPGTWIVEAASHRGGSIIDGAVLGRARSAGPSAASISGQRARHPQDGEAGRSMVFPALPARTPPRDGDPLAAHARRERLLLRLSVVTSVEGPCSCRRPQRG